MKRIDDKIKEIEKKDKNSRVLYIIIVLLIAGFMAYALSSEKTKKEQGETIVGQEKTIEQQLVDLEAKNEELKATITRLEKSQTPIGFWNQTDEAKNTSAYINYILHTGKPEAKEEYKALALENIAKEDTKGKTVWLFCGRKSGDKISSDRVMEVIYRKDETPSGDTLPIPGDLIENNTSNRITYRSFSGGNVTGQNNDSDAWKRGNKAQVLNVETAGTAVFIQIKF
ncbi:hypothetical protein MWU58_07465 [Flavobacteriaceae bacterium S0825]|uniref:hypothetical protein n=1 Tax=Gaetbulibacter sp. S0825 TaxID=2720084 RepID=UPI001431692B|nr:hypothetical protein [Gaetbulibacter sp. S0825]MCK0109125.1 hypothetical protein [Flavobacteriaceae bacterium S0825]NIX64760.1 hypothetical protein [Gaetbulibacter sp. S0825]